MAEEKREVRQIVSGKVKEKTVLDKASDVFLSEDARSVKDYIIYDVIIPTIKNGIADTIIGAIEMAFFGSPRSRRSSSGGGKIVNYSSYSSDSRRNFSGHRVASSNHSDRYDYNNVYLDSRGDAEEVITSMEDLIRDYGEATVADLKSLVGLTNRPIDNKWGWTDCRDFHVSRSGRGYVLDFAQPIYLD